MITICWAAKGGSGTTVVAATRALTATEPTLLVDLAGDLPAMIGLPEPDGPGLRDWLGSTADAERLSSLEVEVTSTCRLLPVGHSDPLPIDRWSELAARFGRERRQVVIDAGTSLPPAALVDVADHNWLVTRACYLSLRAAVRCGGRPTGVVLVEERGRVLGTEEIETAIGAPVVATVLVDPAIARAVDAGLLISRLPSAFRRQLSQAA
jgi:hypothetical protein